MRWLNGIIDSIEQTLGDNEGREACSPWGHKESDMTERLNNNKDYNSLALKY